MKKNQAVQYVLLLFCLFVFGCSQEETTAEETIAEELLLTTLNASDLEILENCGTSLGNNQGANCCVVFPDSVVVNGTYFGGSRYIISEGNSSVFEPEGLTYEWKFTGNGIKISDATAQFVIMEFDQSFEGALLEATVFASDGTPRCIALDSIHLKP